MALTKPRADRGVNWPMRWFIIWGFESPTALFAPNPTFPELFLVCGLERCGFGEHFFGFGFEVVGFVDASTAFVFIACGIGGFFFEFL